MSNLATHKSGYLLAVIVALLFGFYPACLHQAYADQGNAVFVCLAIVWTRALGLTIHCLLKRKPMFQTREDIKQGLIGGFFQAISSGCTMLALDYLQGSQVVMILFTSPLMLLFYSIWRGDFKFKFSTAVLTIAALAGLALVLDIAHAKPVDNILGMVLAFIAAIAMVPRLYVYGQQTRDRDPAIVGAENFLTAALLTLPLVFIQWPMPPHSLVGNGWLFLGCTTLATGTFYTFYGISKLGSFSWSLMQKLQPVFTALISAILIHEILKPQQYLGMAVVLVSLAFYQMMQKKKLA